MSFSRLRIYIYALLMVMLLVSCVGAVEVVATKQSVLKVVESIDKLTEAVTVVNISNGIVTSEVTVKSESFVTDTLRKIGVVKPILEQIAPLEGIDKYRVTAEYVENNANLLGKHTVTNGNKTTNITIYNHAYESETGMNKFNVSATVNGKSLLIHNPVRVYGIPITVTQLRTETTYMDPLEIMEGTSALKGYFISNGTKIYNMTLVDELSRTPVSTIVKEIVDAPTESVLANLAYALSYVEYGEPTFDDPDPTAIWYTSGSWTIPTHTTDVNATIVGGGGGASGGYSTYLASNCWYGDYCEVYCNSDVIYVTDGGVAGAPGEIKVVKPNVTIGATYTITVGTGGVGGEKSA